MVPVIPGLIHFGRDEFKAGKVFVASNPELGEFHLPDFKLCRTHAVKFFYRYLFAVVEP